MQTSVSQLSGRRPATAVKPAALAFSQRAVVTQVLCCAVPAMALFAAGRATLAGYCFWGVFGLVLVQLVARGRMDELLCLVLALMPLINLLRAFAVYNIILLLLLGTLAGFCVRDGATAWRIWRNYPLAIVLLVGTAAYYACSFLLTGRYAANLRMMELSLPVMCLLLIGRHRVLLSATLMGFCLAAVIVGLAFLALSPSAVAGRLGMIFIEDQVMGNPTQLGLPLALSWLVLVVDHGRWSGFGQHKFWRWCLAAIVFSVLALTTSRASWAVAIIGVVVSLIVGSRQRWRMLLLLGAGVAGVQLLLLSPYGDGFQRGLNRTGGGTLAHRTSGRSDQWQVAYRAATETTGALLHGYGPGLGSEVYARVSQETPDVKYAVGEKVAWHSLFMQVTIETGLLGLSLLVVWLIVASGKVVAWTYRQKVVFPLACFIGYVVVVATVSGNDTTSATMLGIGILATGRRQA